MKNPKQAKQAVAAPAKGEAAPMAKQEEAAAASRGQRQAGRRGAVPAKGVAAPMAKQEEAASRGQRHAGRRATTGRRGAAPAKGEAAPMTKPYTNARSEHKEAEPLPTAREHLQGGRTKGETLQETEKQN
jgi:hypothetical protein